MRNTCRNILMTVLALGILLTLGEAFAQSIPIQANPGVVQTHQIRQTNMQQTQPWLMQPYFPKDVDPSEDMGPVIEFENIDVQGQILNTKPKQAPPKSP